MKRSRKRTTSTATTSTSPPKNFPKCTRTILFTDFVGSTELTNRQGDAAREVLGRCDELGRKQVEKHRGHEVKGTGNRLMVAFTSARRAVACAPDIQRAIVERGRRDAAREQAYGGGMHAKSARQE